MFRSALWRCASPSSPSAAAKIGRKKLLRRKRKIRRSDNDGDASVLAPSTPPQGFASTEPLALWAKNDLIKISTLTVSELDNVFGKVTNEVSVEDYFYNHCQSSTVRRTGTVITLALDSPPANILTEPLLNELNTALIAIQRLASFPEFNGESTTLRIGEDDAPNGEDGKKLVPICVPSSPHAVIITSKHRDFFSTGLDLKVLGSQPLLVEQFAPYWQIFQSVFMNLHAMPIPVACAANGHSPGAGSILAMACDFRLAARNSIKKKDAPCVTGVTAVRGGFAAPRWVAANARSIIGHRLTEKLFASGELVTHEEAIKCGLYDGLVEEQLEDAHGPFLSCTHKETVRRLLTDGWLEASSSTTPFSFVKDTMRYGEVVQPYLGSAEARAEDGQSFFEMLREPTVASVLAKYSSQFKRK